MFLAGIITLSSITGSARSQNKLPDKRTRIVVEAEFSKELAEDKLRLQYTPYDFVVAPSEWKTLKPQIKGSKAKWILYSDTPLLVNLTSILGRGNKLNLYEPGDSIHINLRKGAPVYSGTNADKFKMLQEMKARETAMDAPQGSRHDASNTLQTYLAWNSYLNGRLDLLQTVYASYQGRVTPLAYEYLKANSISEIEYTRLMWFGSLVNDSARLGISGENLGHIFDSTAHNSSVAWLQTCTGITSNYYYYYDYVRKSVQRRFNFNSASSILQSVKRKVLYADLAKQLYKDNVLQGCLVYLLTGQGLKEHTLKTNDPEIDTLLAAFYDQPRFDPYKKYVRAYEKKIRGWIISIGNNAPDFSLSQQNGMKVKKAQLSGKVTVLNFFQPKCRECVEMNKALDNVKNTFRGDSNVVFLYISVDKDSKILQSNITSFSGNRLDLYTGNTEEYESIIKHYDISSYPEVLLLDRWGKFAYNGRPDTGYRYDTLPDPRKDNGKQLISKIYEQLTLSNDGPYVMHANDSAVSYLIKGSAIIKNKHNLQSRVLLNVQTDDYHKKFTVTLKKAHQAEPTEYDQPEKLFVLSDIEGNFNAFRKLLQAGNVIDSQYNWIYGTGHLVFTGDMFDRGKQVTECLWLIYSLEEKAKAAGGYVHFILGNHEIMNLTGDTRYVDQKYKKTAALLNLPYVNLFDENSELGKWIRTKNVIEKIGNLLFVHGGISKEINELDISIEKINKASRLYYSDPVSFDKRTDKIASAIHNPDISPFWSRSYYDKDPSKRAPETIIDDTLKKFNVLKIITGHTIIAKEISMHYNGKVINIDTKHSKGESEALVIERNNYFRMNARGEKEMLTDKIGLAVK